MQWYEFVIYYFEIVLMEIIYIKCYEKISFNKKITFTLNIFLIVILSSAIAFFNMRFNTSVSRMIISFFLLLFTNFLIFKQKITISFLKTLVIYIISCVGELLLSPIILIFNTKDLYDFKTLLLVGLVISSFNMLFTYLFFSIKKIQFIFINFFKKISHKHVQLLNIILIILFIVITIMMFNFAFNMNILSFVTELIIITLFIVILFITLYQYIKFKKSEEKEEILLNFMSKYEQIIDEDRINRHEILNNLLIIKSYKNKNGNEFSKTLDEIIKLYSSKKEINGNLYNLPTGLKGLIYYKIYDMKNDNININLNISPKTVTAFEKMPPKIFMDNCKIIGILLDNAREAAKESKNKTVVIDIYKDKNNLKIYIENSTKNAVNISKINTKDFSTKGKNRGLGLFVVNRILEKEPTFQLEQNYTNYIFSSILTIKKHL